MYAFLEAVRDRMIKLLLYGELLTSLSNNAVYSLVISFAFEMYLMHNLSYSV